MIVISDTSPLSGLFRIGYLHLFEPLYGKIIIPPAVKDELLELVHFGSDPSQILSQPWLEIRAFQNAALYQNFGVNWTKVKRKLLPLRSNQALTCY